MLGCSASQSCQSLVMLFPAMLASIPTVTTWPSISASTPAITSEFQPPARWRKVEGTRLSAIIVLRKTLRSYKRETDFHQILPLLADIWPPASLDLDISGKLCCVVCCCSYFLFFPAPISTVAIISGNIKGKPTQY